ncbi:hypothetical protein SM978_25390 [Escherichia coli]|nr:hypothetical protein [Escherichia coli]
MLNKHPFLGVFLIFLGFKFLSIKEKFGARWLPAKAKNSDFPGNWWIIETKHNVADVLAVIQQYA